MERLSRNGSGWILVAGFALVTLGLVAESRPRQEQEIPPPGTPPVGQQQPTFAPPVQGWGTADSNGRMIAVTGLDVTGGSLLYLVDTETKHLSVYQATGGTKSTMKVQWVGGRNIALDLAVDGWNDKSDISYKELEAEFAARGPSEVGD